MKLPIAVASALLAFHAQVLEAADPNQMLTVIEDFHSAALDTAKKPLKNVEKDYRGKLEKYKLTVKEAGNIKAWDAADAAIKILDQGDPIVPSTEPGVAEIQKAYSAQRKIVELEANRAIAKEDQDYLESLRNLVKESTKKGEFDLARQAQAKLDEIGNATKPANPNDTSPSKNDDDFNRQLSEAKAKALKEFPEISKPDSPISKQVKSLQESKKITPSFFKNPQWPYLLAQEASSKMTNENSATHQGKEDKSVADRLIGTKWQWWDDQSMEFRADSRGVFRHPGQDDIQFSWRVTPDGKIRYQKDNDPHRFILELIEDQIKITNPEGKFWSGKFLGKVK